FVSAAYQSAQKVMGSRSITSDAFDRSIAQVHPKVGNLLDQAVAINPKSRFVFFFQAEDGIRDGHVTGVQTCALPILIEGALLAAMGGVLGALLSLAVYTYVVVGKIQFGTMDFQSFAETVFQFRVTPDLMLSGVVFSVLVGLAGSLLPALRAARLPVIAALKSI